MGLIPSFVWLRDTNCVSRYTVDQQERGQDKVQETQQLHMTL